MARKAISEAGLGERVEIRHGDANELDEQNAYDLVTMSIALHETGGPAEYRNVLNRVRRAQARRDGSSFRAALPRLAG